MAPLFDEDGVEETDSAEHAWRKTVSHQARENGLANLASPFV